MQTEKDFSGRESVVELQEECRHLIVRIFIFFRPLYKWCFDCWFRHLGLQWH